jgi:protein-S-isoprenylcysteine O-methyltransferase Ste14
VLLFVRAGEAAPSILLTIAGAACIGAGEALRLWGVHHIGVISRTRSERLGPLIDSGPFAYVRNPLYIGNILLWTGFAFAARLVWFAPIVAVVLALEYHAIVAWEERLLVGRIGDAYREYQRRVPRWIPKVGLKADTAYGGLSWRATLFSERSTLIAIAAGYLLLWIKARF